MNGFLNLLKPPGMSSAAAVGFVKRLTGEKTGHAGTLDPEACGVLPVFPPMQPSSFSVPPIIW